MTAGGLGLRPAPDDRHHQRYPLRASLASGRLETPAYVERRLDVNTRWRHLYNQQEEGACVGMGLSFYASIVNRATFDPWWLYRRAQEIDEFTETPPEPGTTLRAGCEVLRLEGHRPHVVRGGVIQDADKVPPSLSYRILTYRWTRSVDECRAAADANMPILFGIPWMAKYDEPEERRRWLGLRRSEWWIGHQPDLGRFRGYHCICAYGARDSVDAFPLVNSWGVERVVSGRVVDGYPLVNWPYEQARRNLERGDAEAVVITDYVPPV